MHSIKDKRLIKKQSHILTEVVAIGSINFGLLLLGIDLIDRCTVLIVSSDDLEIKGSINLGSKKVPRSMKCLPGSNRFFLRYDTVLSLYQIVDTNHATELQAHNLGIRGYAIDIQSAAQKVVVSDPFKYVVTYDYKNTILPLCRNIGPYMVNDVVFLGNALITGDKGGLLRVLEFNMADPCDINKTMMTSVGSLYVSE